MGGTSAERAVSLSTGKQILNALDPARYTVHALDTATGQTMLPAATPLIAENGGHAVTALTQLPTLAPQERPDVVVIALHGPGGEDGTVQGMLEVLGIPYTGSGVLASALAMDKAMAKRVLTSDGVLMARDVALRRGDAPDAALMKPLLPPWVVKPNAQGSTIGMSIVRDAANLDAALDLAFRHDGTVLVEEFIEGVEITVPIIGNAHLEILPIVEIVPASGFYDYEAKYTPGATEEICPARLSAGLTRRANEIAYQCHRLLGCRGMSRTDMIVTPGGEIYTLEVNTIPGMTPTSLLPYSASVAGYTFSQLLDKLISLALESR
jgi:D-alanine-D-alanine ligase